MPLIEKPKSPTFGENDIVVDREEILLLGRDNPIVHACLRLWQNSDLTFEQAMMSAVKFLASQNKNMFEELVKQANERITPMDTVRIMFDEK